MSKIINRPVVELDAINQGEGETLVFLHGWAADKTVWLNQAELLRNKYNIILLDLRGYGLSAYQQDQDLLSAMAADVIVFLQKNQINRANIIGWSLGGQTALRLTLDRPELVKSLTLVSATPKFIISEEDNSAGHRKNKGRSKDEGLVLLGIDIKKDLISGISDFQSRLFCRAEIKEKRFRPAFQILKQCKPPSPDAALAGLEVLKKTDLCLQLKNVQARTLIIHGREDTICPFGAAEYMAQEIPNARLEILDNTGHVPHLTRPEKFNSILNDFLKEGREFQ